MNALAILLLIINVLEVREDKITKLPFKAIVS